jgi:hypothetical protein
VVGVRIVAAGFQVLGSEAGRWALRRFHSGGLVLAWFLSQLAVSIFSCFAYFAVT